MRTPNGPATIEIVDSGSDLRVRAWGPGAGWATDRSASLVGVDRDSPPIPALHPLLAELDRRLRGVRQPRTERVVESLLPAVLEQKITGEEARRTYRGIVRAFGEAAPGPFGLWLQPTPPRLAGLPYYAFHPLGLERRRAEVLRRVGAAAEALEEAVKMPMPDAHRRLGAVPGIGPWTVNEVARDALGDPDAVSIGDYHLPSLVCFALAGEPRGDDARMLDLLEPYRGQRSRVIRLLELSGIRPPRYGPRMPPRHIAGH